MEMNSLQTKSVITTSKDNGPTRPYTADVRMISANNK